MNSLKDLDTHLRRILDVIGRKAPRPYEVVVLSDHGQSVGATFEQRYGQTLSEFIKETVSAGSSVTEVDATENPRGQTAALLAEIQGIEQRAPIGRVPRAAIGRARKQLQKRLGDDALPALMDAQVIVCVSGNLANVYFDLHTGRVGLNELNGAHPALVNSLVTHPGIGLVVTYQQHDEPWVLGKAGARNLRDGDIIGSDPLIPYGDPDHCAAQLHRLAGFPHSGDLIIISTLYPDGHVAAFEELVGSHGGLGGQQTEPFLFHPADVIVPPTSNATDAFALLDARRGMAGDPLRPRPVVTETEVSAWASDTIRKGLRDTKTWISRAASTLVLDRGAFQEVADDPLATGPALLILLLVLIGWGFSAALDPGIAGSGLSKFAGGFVGRLAGWLLLTTFTMFAGRRLGGRGSFTRVARTLAYAQIPWMISWLGAVPGYGALFAITGEAWRFLAMWTAMQEALALRRMRAALIPVVGSLILVGTVVVIATISTGITLTAETMLSQLGFGPGS